MNERRRQHFCWQGHEELARLRSAFPRERLAMARAVYSGLTEIASMRYREGGGDRFVGSKRQVAEHIGVSERTLDQYVRDLGVAGLLSMQRRHAANGAELPPEWILVTPAALVEVGVQLLHPPADDAAPAAPPTRARQEALDVDTPRAASQPGPQGPKHKVNRKPVTDAEMARAKQWLGVFNVRAGSKYSLQAHLVPLVMRGRENPDVTIEQLRAAIHKWFDHPWWHDSKPGPGVIFGTAAVFEKTLQSDPGSAPNGKVSKADSRQAQIDEALRQARELADQGR